MITSVMRQSATTGDTAVGTPDFDVEKAIGLSEAAKMLRGRGGKRPHVETLRRWATRGCAAGKQKILLRSILLNGERLTTVEWVKSFDRARIVAGLDEEVVPVQSARERTKSVERANAYLDRVGVGTKKSRS
jgi:hypothetical protein